MSDYNDKIVQALLTVNAISDNDLDFIVDAIKEETDLILTALSNIENRLLTAQEFIVAEPADASFIVNTVKPRIINIESIINAEVTRLVSLVNSMEFRSKIVV